MQQRTSHPSDVTTAVRRVAVIDSDPIFRRGLVSVLQATPATLVVADGIDSTAVHESLDALIFELEGGGLMKAIEAKEARPMRLIGILREADSPLAIEAASAGVAGLLLRRSLSPERLVSTLRSVFSEAASLPSHLLPALLEQAALGVPRVPHRLQPREVDVLRHLSEGCDTREIASSLGYSERTVKNVVHDLLMKMNCRNRAHAVATATRVGLI